MYFSFFKRFFDIIFSSCFILLFTPLFVVIYIIVKLDSSGPFFFFQERLGYRGVTFHVFKIRTMTDRHRVDHQEIFATSSEITSVGRILRRLKMDELPQLINVFLGDMSIVGPRPCLVSQLDELNEDGRKRLLVRPGLTGLAQINGNIYLSWPERWVYDSYYVQNLSLFLDLKIILKTIKIVISGEDKFINKPKND